MTVTPSPMPTPPHWAARSPEARLGVVLIRVAVLATALACLVVDYAFAGRPDHPIHLALPDTWLHAIEIALVTIYALDVWVGAYFGRLALRDEMPDWIDLLLIMMSALGAGGYFLIPHIRGLATAPLGPDLPTWAWHLFETSLMLLLLAELWRLNAVATRRLSRPEALLPISFLLTIAVGTLLLKLPPAVPPGQDISWLDALFTITSAVCVTGLIVRDTATSFTPFGQTVIGVFIQLGGLGIIVFGSMLAMLMGTRLSLRENLSMSSMLQGMPLKRIDGFIRFIVFVTLACELVGAIALMGLWGDGVTLHERVGLSAFHAVSAFCNAGFALQSNSLESYRHAPLIHLVVLPLIVIGGLGFPVLSDLSRAARWRCARCWGRLNVFRTGWADALGWAGRSARADAHVSDKPDLSPRRLSLHTKVVLVTTAVLYLYGVVALTAGQLKPYLNHALQQGVTANRVEPPPLTIRHLGGVLADASFMSVTARTAGFNTVPMGDISRAGYFVLMTLMMVGASPGGTAGGMKTTTAALLVLSIAATIRGRRDTEAFNRTVDDALVRNAATLAACFIALVTLSTLLLTFSEPYPFGKIAFEAVSAASTTGLSLGITPDLTAFGKTVIILTMFAGRVGPLALLVVLVSGGRRRPTYAYPHESVLIG